MTQHRHHSTKPDSSPVSSLTLENIVVALRERGMRLTRNRQHILQVMLDAHEPLSLEEIQSRSGEFGEAAPDFATVFRVMSALEKLHLAQKVNLGRSCSHYELIDPQKHHDHIVCVDCGKVTLIEEECPVTRVERKLEKQYGFTNLTHSLEFFGTCLQCAESSAA